MENEENLNDMRDDTAYKKEIKVFWKNLTVRYWYLVLIFGLLVLGAIAGFLLTLNWYTKTDIGSGTKTIGQMSIRGSILWIVMFFVWEILIVALPTLLVAGGVAAIIWFIVLPEDLKEECKAKFKKAEKHEEGCEKKHHKKKHGHRGSQSGGAFTFLVFVGVLIYIAIDGNWNVPFEASNMTINYFAGRWIQVFLWGLLILGVPAVTFGLLWYWKKFGKE